MIVAQHIVAMRVTRLVKLPKTITRTIRIDREVLNTLENDAKDMRLSFNSYISSILKRQVEWGRYTEKGFVTMTVETFKSILDAVQDHEIRAIGQDVGDRIYRQNMLYWFKEVSLKSFLEFVSLYSRNSGLFEADTENDERGYTVTMRHDFGRKWSTFLSNSMSRAIKNIVGSSPRCQTNENIVVVRFMSSPEKYS